MNKKVGDVFRILLGCYLIFLGVCLWIQVSKAGPTDEQLMTLMAVILIAVGTVSFLLSVMALISCLKGEGYFRKKRKRSAADDTVEIRLNEQEELSAVHEIPDRTEDRRVKEDIGKTEEMPVIQDIGGTEKMPVTEDIAKTEEMPVIEDDGKTEEMPEKEDIGKTEEIERDYEER